MCCVLKAQLVSAAAYQIISPIGCVGFNTVKGTSCSVFGFWPIRGVSKQNRNRKSKIELTLNKALIGLCPKHVPHLFLGSEKMNDLQPNAKIKKLTAGNRKGNRKHEQQQFSASYWSAQPRQTSTSGPPYTASYPQLARQHSRTDPPVSSQQVNHNTSPDVLGSLFPCVRA